MEQKIRPGDQCNLIPPSRAMFPCQLLGVSDAHNGPTPEFGEPILPRYICRLQTEGRSKLSCRVVEVDSDGAIHATLIDEVNALGLAGGERVVIEPRDRY